LHIRSPCDVERVYYENQSDISDQIGDIEKDVVMSIEKGL